MPSTILGSWDTLVDNFKIPDMIVYIWERERLRKTRNIINQYIIGYVEG